LSNGITLLLGLRGVTVDRVVLRVDGTREVHVLTADPTAAGCPSCGEVSVSPKQWVTTRPRDLPYGEAPVAVVWRKRRWRCRVVECLTGSFTESIPEVPPRARVTSRVRRAVGAAVGDANRAVSEVAASFGVSWPTAHAAVVEAAAVALVEPEPTEVLGVDETRRGKPRWERDPVTGMSRRVDRWDTGFVDLAGDQGLLGQVEGRTTATVTDWLSERTPEFRAAITYVVIDPAAVYRSAITPDLLPNAQVVVDHFHLVKLANDALTDVRRRLTWALRGRRGRKLDPEWANRRRLLTARGRLSGRAFTRPARHLIARRLGDFYHWCAAADIPELNRLATTVENWWPEIERFIDTGLTNARTEGINRIIKDVGRRACGFRNPTNHRRRVRFHCTRKSRRVPATPAAKPA
jgi:transposase